METLGATSVCLLEQLRPLLRAWAFVTYYTFTLQMLHFVGYTCLLILCMRVLENFGDRN
jgi:hypothetical protein